MIKILRLVFVSIIFHVFDSATAAPLASARSKQIGEYKRRVLLGSTYQFRLDAAFEGIGCPNKALALKAVDEGWIENCFL